MKTLRTLLVAALTVALAPVVALAQGGTIRGTVTEQGSGNTLQGVQVSVVGTNLTVVTNQQGRFVINNVAAGQRTLRAARIGFTAGTRVVTVGAQPVDVAFTLSPDVLGLDELVVIGYGQTERRNAAGGAIASIRPAEVAADLPTPTISEVLQGRVAGVQVSQNSGTPGSAISVRVRGASSISAGNEPLYVIDGVPAITGDFSAVSGSLGGQNVDALADLNPNEIESIEVLKDASAAAIYGSRASNGVVLITTRRGRAAERPEIRFNAWYADQRPWRIPEFTNAAQYLELYNEAWTNDGYQEIGYETLFDYYNDALGANLDTSGATDTDWLDEVINPAGMASLFGSISGGTERTRYFVSGSRLQQDGIVSPQAYERLNGRLNLDYSVSDKLTLGTSIGLTRSDNDRSASDNNIYSPFANAIAAAPIEPVRGADGELYPGDIYINPVYLRENQVEERGLRVLANAFANYQLTDWLSARLNTGVDQYSNRSYLYNTPDIPPGAPTGTGITGNSYASKVLAEGTLNWDVDVNDANSFTGVVGASYEDNDSEFNFVSGSGFSTDQFRFLNSAAVISGGGDGPTEYNLGSFFGRATHTWADRITTTLNFRADGSTRFGESNRWGFFPSASVLLRPGLSSLPGGGTTFSDLALRASYGLTGNQEGLGDFASLGLFTGGAAYGDRGGIAPAQLPNPDLSWEKTTQLNIGGDLGLFDDRLGVSFDWYRKNTTDLLLARPLPRSTGFAGVTENIGAMTNTGMELALRAQLVRNSAPNGLSWTTEFNVSTNRNKVTELYNNQPIPLGLSSSVRIEEGQPLGFFYGYVADGLFRDQAQICQRLNAQETSANRNARCAAAGLAFQNAGTSLGDLRFRDIDSFGPDGKLTGKPDGIINSADRTNIGSPWPDYQGGWSNNLRFQGVDLTAFFQFSQGNETFNGMRFYYDNPASGDNLRTYVLDRYSEDNPDGTHPRVTLDDVNTNARASSAFVEDGSYVRLKNVVLGYTLPARMSGRIGFNSLRVYAQGQNLVTWTDYSGFDPEVNFTGSDPVTRGYDFYTLPQTRTISIGVDVGL
ncbi:MAG TPA: TonB-dependent receptor [Longimicrobium sp.]|nr:TonB-dependent receptor [Longimicrobium sp.]